MAEKVIVDTLAKTPAPPYYAVIFSSLRIDGDRGYAAMAEKMLKIAATQPGFLGFETARESVGITVSYWLDLASIKHWKDNTLHREAQRCGREIWYSDFRIRIARVEREYGF